MSMKGKRKPVAVIQHTVVGHPGAALTVLDELGIEWQLISLPDGDAIPSSIDAFSGLVIMGGAMSVNDDLPWIAQEIDLIRQARDNKVPVIGHCLGSQLMSNAFGASVRKNNYKELGWLGVAPVDAEKATYWFGENLKDTKVFQWHSDTFGLPPGAEHLLTSIHCKNQAYVLDERHIAMQFHLEMTDSLLEVHLKANSRELDTEQVQKSPVATTVNELREGAKSYMAPMHKILHHVYSRWAQNLV